MATDVIKVSYSIDGAVLELLVPPPDAEAEKVFIDIRVGAVEGGAVLGEEDADVQMSATIYNHDMSFHGVGNSSVSLELTRIPVVPPV